MPKWPFNFKSQVALNFTMRNTVSMFMKMFLKPPTLTCDGQGKIAFFNLLNMSLVAICSFLKVIHNLHRQRVHAVLCHKERHVRNKYSNFGSIRNKYSGFEN